MRETLLTIAAATLVVGSLAAFVVGAIIFVRGENILQENVGVQIALVSAMLAVAAVVAFGASTIARALKR